MAHTKRVSSKEDDTSSFNEAEIEAANALLNMPYLISRSSSDYIFSYSWGSKRRRTVLDAPPEPPCPRPITVVECDGAGDRETSSPNTPFLFERCESDGKKKKKKNQHRRSGKRTKEELQNLIDELTETRNGLVQRVENVKKCYEELKDNNSKLKSLKIKFRLKQENKPENTQSSTAQVHREVLVVAHQQPLTVNATAENEFRGIPDLNLSTVEISPEEGAVQIQPLDEIQMKMMRRANAALARKRRMTMNKMKKMPRGRR